MLGKTLQSFYEQAAREVGTTISVSSAFEVVEKSYGKAKARWMFRSAGLVRTTARRSIRRRKGASQPGTPPNTHTGRLRNAVLFAVLKDGAVIGPSADIVGPAGQPHEHGGEFRGEQYQPRPYMSPALEKSQTAIVDLWKDSVVK